MKVPQAALRSSEWLERSLLPHDKDIGQFCDIDEAHATTQIASCEEWSAGKVFSLFPDKQRIAQSARLESFRALQHGWDSYDAEPPSDVAIDNARRILHVLWCSDTAPPLRQISPSVEGGVAVVFTGREKRYADIECFNNGDILAITSDGVTEPLVWSLNKEGGSIRSAIEKLNAFFDGY